jgi:hypothetical protein
MITIEDIKKWSKPHPMSKYLGKGGGNGRMSRFGTKKIEFSIVGGDRGLYGDFDTTFEVAIFDRVTNQFLTKFFYDRANDDVIPYMSASEVEKLVNSTIKKEDLTFTDFNE